MAILKLAFRSLRNAPGFSAVAILALALGIGANSAIFSLINGIFLRPLPYAQPEQIVQLTSTLPAQNLNQAPFSLPRLRAVRERQDVFSDIAVSTPTVHTVVGQNEPEQVNGLVVSQNFFPLLGMQPQLGRNFLPEEDRAGGADAVLLSFAYWTTHYGARADAIGQSITLDGRPHTIVGVMPRKLSAFPLNQAALFTTRPDEVPFVTKQQIDNGGFFFTAYARLKPGVDLTQARAAMAVIQHSYEAAHPSFADAHSQITVGFLLDDLIGNQRQTYTTLFAAVGCVLLIACANVANLMLTRFLRRRKEIGIRFALGARRSHIVAQFLAESVLLSLAGGILGLGLAALSLMVVARVGANLIPRIEEISLDPSVVAFTLGVSIFAGLALGLVPALQASMNSVNSALKESSRGSTSDRTRNRFRSGLLITEVALSFVLLIATSLLVASFVRIRNVSPGFRPEGVFTAFLVPPPTQYPARDGKTVDFYRRLYRGLAGIPGAKAVALSDNPPLSGNNGPAPYAAVGQPIPPLAEQPMALRHLISPNRFAVLGIPFVQGRDFTEEDTPDKPAVIIINQAMAKKLFPNESAIGHQVVTGMAQKTAEIVGVVADNHTADLTSAPVPEMFHPVLQRPENFTAVMVRTDGDPAAMAASVRRVLHDVDPGIPLTAPGKLQDFLDQSMADRKLTMTLLIVFAGLALTLASLGVYSVMAYLVAQRSGEIGIRMALGARAGDVQKMVIRQGMRLAGVGVGIGVLVALGVTRLMQAVLFEVGTSDPLIYFSIAALLAGVAVCACWLPSRRAARVDPMVALHEA